MVKLTIEENFKLKVYDLVKNEYTVIGDYLGSKTIILIRHNCKDCNNSEFLVTPNSFISKGVRCHDCSISALSKRFAKTTENHKQEVFKLVGEEYEVLEEYKNNKTKILYKHNSLACNNNKFYQTPNGFLDGHMCPVCGIQKRAVTQSKNTIDFKIEVEGITNNEYTILGEYKKVREKVLFKHNLSCCENSFMMTPNAFLKGARCPVCSESKGEQKIRYVLECKNIIFNSQYTFENLNGVGGKPLRFDFAVLKDNQVSYLIEYQGELHYMETTLNNDLKKQKIHDDIKRNYCKDSKIKLLEIPYWEFSNIDQILSNTDKLN